MNKSAFEWVEYAKKLKTENRKLKEENTKLQKILNQLDPLSRLRLMEEAGHGVKIKTPAKLTYE